MNKDNEVSLKNWEEEFKNRYLNGEDILWVDYFQHLIDFIKELLAQKDEEVRTQIVYYLDSLDTAKPKVNLADAIWNLKQGNDKPKEFKT